MHSFGERIPRPATYGDRILAWSANPCEDLTPNRALSGAVLL
jgi:hypothetical protein